MRNSISSTQTAAEWLRALVHLAAEQQQQQQGILIAQQRGIQASHHPAYFMQRYRSRSAKLGLKTIKQALHRHQAAMRHGQFGSQAGLEIRIGRADVRQGWPSHGGQTICAFPVARHLPRKEVPLRLITPAPAFNAIHIPAYQAATIAT
jgi:hypothetical protein